MSRPPPDRSRPTSLAPPYSQTPMRLSQPSFPPQQQPRPSSAAFGPPPQSSGYFAQQPRPSSTALISASQPNGGPSRPHSRVEPPPLTATAGPMPGTLERPIHGPRKRLIVCCDGTWLNADNGMTNGQQTPPSNVSRIGWAIKDTSRDGIPQIVYYQAGVASTGGRLSRYVGGATGLGLKENVREGYAYLATNWREGDEVFVLGFSRGAFTARSIAGLIGEVGLLTRSGLPYFSEIFEDVEQQHNPRYVSKSPDAPFPNKPPFGNAYAAELTRLGFSRRQVPIKAVGVWDTVGALGIPRVSLLETLRIQSPTMKEYTFYDTRLNPCIENAFQALALDECRAPFSPTLWEKRDTDRTNLKQVWFPGVHSNVGGGGYDDSELSNITLAWMMSRLEPFIDFAPDYIVTCYNENKAYYHAVGQKTRWWSFGEIYNSLTGYYAVSGSKTRTPGNYMRLDPDTGRQTSKRLKNTNEYIHASVRARVGLRGPGIDDRGVYAPRALADWKYSVEPSPAGGSGMPMIVWTDQRADSQGQKTIPEAVLLETERRLLGLSGGDVEAFVLDLSGKEPVRQRRGKRRSTRLDGTGGGDRPVSTGRKERPMSTGGRDRDRDRRSGR